MKTYRIHVDHHSTYDIDIKRIGKYGLMIRPDETGGWDGCRVHQLASDKELREALERLGSNQTRSLTPLGSGAV